MAEKNEFDDIDEGNPNDFSSAPSEESESSSMISDKGRGEVWDYTKAPEFLKSPPRIDLDGKTVTIKKADVILPAKETPFMRTRAGDKEYKSCLFKLHMETDDKKLQIETLSGVRVFKRDGGYSQPSVPHDEQNQVSRLLGAFARYKGRDIAEVQLKELLMFLNGATPKALMKAEEVTNPKTKEKFKKNLVDKFI